jgi:HEPN domain-containing protein
MSNVLYTRAQIFLIKAAEDEAALHADGNPDTVLGFHAQQAVEKLIKAFLSQLGTPFELTHNLARLQTVLSAAGEVLPATPLPLGALNDYAVVYRYDLMTQRSGPDRADLI